MATDFLAETRNEIGARLTELKPLVAEYERLLAAATALEGVSAIAVAPASPVSRPSASAKASGHRTSAVTNGRRGRPKGSGKRGEEALALVKRRPGITIAEIAETIGIKQNYLYRVLSQLATDGLVRKDGRGWHPNETEAA
jgi:CRP-like cAMP-binding protein